MRILGIDYGSKRVGLSMSDPSGTTATSHGIRHRVSASQDAEFFRDLGRNHQLARVVIGLPLSPEGKVLDRAQDARKYGAWLAAELGLPVEYFEGLPIQLAESKSRTVRARGRKRRRDMLAAQIMLQSYLDSHQSEDLGELETTATD